MLSNGYCQLDNNTIITYKVSNIKLSVSVTSLLLGMYYCYNIAMSFSIIIHWIISMLEAEFEITHINTFIIKFNTKNRNNKNFKI